LERTENDSFHYNEDPRRFVQTTIGETVLVVAPYTVTVVSGVCEEHPKDDNRVKHYEFAVPWLDDINVIVLGKRLDLIFAEIVPIAVCKFAMSILLEGSGYSSIIAWSNLVTRRART
jgi:hypothetical protein